MSQTSDPLEAKVDDIKSKATEYETATSFEAKKQACLNSLDSVKNALARLDRRVQRMEFLATILVDVVKAKDDVPQIVEAARRKTRSVVDHEPDFYYQKINHSEIDEYEQKVRQARSTVKKSIDELENQLREVERDWKNKIDAARNVQKLFGDSPKKTRMFSDIESFVDRRMWDDSNSVSSLRSEWNGLQKRWDKGGIDWETFQRDNKLSPETISILKNLAEGKSVTLGRLDENIARELLSVEDLHGVVKIKI